MLNFTLYKRGMRGSWKTLIIFASVQALYFTTVISMFDPALGSALEEFSKVMPELMAIVGMNPSSATMLGFLSAYLYGFIMLVFPMVFSILCANKLIVRHLDRGSMAYLLAAPVNRRSVAFTQMSVIVSGIFILTAFSSLLGILVCESSFPGELEIGGFMLLNAGVFCLHLFIGSICFLCACAFSDAKLSLGLGAGIPSLAFVIKMMSNAGAKLESAKYATFFTLFNPDGVAAGSANALYGAAVLLAGSIILFASAVVIFDKRDLHI